MIKINKLKTFRELQEFTKEFSHVKFLKEKTYNRQYLYCIVYTAIKEKIAVPFLNIINIETEKEQNSKKIASSFYPYDMAIENSFIQDDNYHNNVMKNILNEEKIKKEKETLKEKYKRSLDITVFTALSNKQDKKTLEENAPAILTMLETLKGTEAENKKMTVRQALEIFNNFISQTKNDIPFDTNKIRNQTNIKQQSNFDSKKNKRIEKLEKEIEKLEAQKKNSNDKDSKILDKEINALKKTIEKITQERLKEQTYIDEATNNKEKFPAERVQAHTKLAEEKIVAKGQTKKEAAGQNLKQTKKLYEKKKKISLGEQKELIKEKKEKKEKNLAKFEQIVVKPKESQTTKTKDDLDMSSSSSKEELAEAKKGRSKEV
jgi:hypothetical protein